MCGVIGGSCDDLTLKEICQRFDGKLYYDQMQAAEIVAGICNTNGGLSGGRAALFTDFHPQHSADETSDEGVDADMLMVSAAAALGLKDVRNQTQGHTKSI